MHEEHAEGALGGPPDPARGPPAGVACRDQAEQREPRHHRDHRLEHRRRTRRSRTARWVPVATARRVPALGRDARHDEGRDDDSRPHRRLQRVEHALAVQRDAAEDQEEHVQRRSHRE